MNYSLEHPATPGFTGTVAPALPQSKNLNLM